MTNILKFVRRRLESTAELIQLNVVASWRFFFTAIIFVSSSFFLGYISYVVHIISVKSLVRYFCGRLRKISH